MSTGLQVDVDLAMIVAALAPTLAILTTAWVQARKLAAVHTLVNDQMTREKAARLDDLKAQKSVLERVLGPDMTEADREMLSQMERRIAQLTEEVERRDRTADTLSKGAPGDET